MRIAFDYQAFVLQPYGGISRYFTRLAQGVLEAGQQTGIFAPLFRNKYLPSLPREVVFGRQISSYPSKTWRLFRAYNQWRALPEIAKWRPDIVHETYYARVGSAPMKCPTVITVYDMIQELFADDMSLMDNTATLKRIAIERADHVICISENTRQDLMRMHGTPARKLSVVHLGFDNFVAGGVSLAEKACAGKQFLLYVGVRSEYKNFAGLLRAVASSRRLISDFDIVAFGGSGFTSAELRLIQSLGFAEGQVRHCSGVDEVLGRLYDSARAFVYPSKYEGFGIPPLEAMAHRCPVICSNTSSIPEVVKEAGEYFNPADVADMQRAIEAVVYSDSRVDELRELGSRRLDAFSWNKCTQETLDVYRALA
jgi:glycosyltransferase involved in cell wall biosynthesis